MERHRFNSAPSGADGAAREPEHSPESSRRTLTIASSSDLGEDYMSIVRTDESSTCIFARAPPELEDRSVPCILGARRWFRSLQRRVRSDGSVALTPEIVPDEQYAERVYDPRNSQTSYAQRVFLDAPTLVEDPDDELTNEVKAQRHCLSVSFGAGQSLSPDELQSYMSVYGKVLRVEILERQDGNRSNIALLLFEKASSARDVLDRLNGREIFRVIVHLELDPFGRRARELLRRRPGGSADDDNVSTRTARAGTGRETGSGSAIGAVHSGRVPHEEDRDDEGDVLGADDREASILARFMSGGDARMLPHSALSPAGSDADELPDTGAFASVPLYPHSSTERNPAEQENDPEMSHRPRDVSTSDPETSIGGVAPDQAALAALVGADDDDDDLTLLPKGPSDGASHDVAPDVESESSEEGEITDDDDGESGVHAASSAPVRAVAAPASAPMEEFEAGELTPPPQLGDSPEHSPPLPLTPPPLLEDPISSADAPTSAMEGQRGPAVEWSASATITLPTGGAPPTVGAVQRAPIAVLQAPVHVPVLFADRFPTYEAAHRAACREAAHALTQELLVSVCRELERRAILPMAQLAIEAGLDRVRKMQFLTGTAAPRPQFEDPLRFRSVRKRGFAHAFFDNRYGPGRGAPALAEPDDLRERDEPGDARKRARKSQEVKKRASRDEATRRAPRRKEASGDRDRAAVDEDVAPDAEVLRVRKEVMAGAATATIHGRTVAANVIREAVMSWTPPENESGCARGEAFARINPLEKKKYLAARFLTSKSLSPAEEAMVRAKTAAPAGGARGARAISRRALAAAAPGDNASGSQLWRRHKLLKFEKSLIHDWGLFALESIERGDMVIEYVGEKIRSKVADVREMRYEREGIGSSYMFRIDEDTVIDATRKGNLARFINHCCVPNCTAKIVNFDGEKRIVFYALQKIGVGEEITYDYKFPEEDEKIPCLCGHPQCRKYLN